MKIFEKVVHQQVVDFLDLCNILSSSQSGFRNAHSTDTAVICVSDFILDELSKGNYVGPVLFDLKNAFDTVDHQILLKKLFSYGFRDIYPLVSLKVQSLDPYYFFFTLTTLTRVLTHKKTFHHLYADDTIIILSLIHI